MLDGGWRVLSCMLAKMVRAGDTIDAEQLLTYCGGGWRERSHSCPVVVSADCISRSLAMLNQNISRDGTLLVRRGVTLEESSGTSISHQKPLSIIEDS